MDDLIDVHDAYLTMAASGVVTEAQRSVFNRASGPLLNDGAEAIMLRGTDLALVYDPQTSEFPLIDCASIHVGAIARLALGYYLSMSVRDHNEQLLRCSD